ncbi:MAG: hypothetical protein PHR39_01760 [Actinomycetota bacterium]|nr:hypothetical protein [Actinomycetota bacterium]
MKFFGNVFDKKELVKIIDDITQLGSTKLDEIVDGIGKEIRVTNLKHPLELI